MINKALHKIIRGHAVSACGSKSLLMALLAILMISGCSGLQTFSQVARPGDTVALAIHRLDIKPGDATIVITDPLGTETSFPGNDAQVKSWVNMYPDPVSRLIVGRETSQNMNSSAIFNGLAIENETGLEKDWYETVVFVNLPATMSTGGVATIDVQSPLGTSLLPQPVSVMILAGAGTGAPHPFEINEQAGPLSTEQFRAMRRANHFAVSLSGATVPTAVQIDLSHDPDRENGGSGQAYVVHPRGDIKSVSWTDTGTTLRVMLMPAWHKTTEDINAEYLNSERLEWFKFYVAGNITGLIVDNISAYDINGDTVPGITATIQ